MSAMTSGRVATRISLQPSRAGPPKSSAAEVAQLQVGAEGAVEHEHPIGERGEERVHGATSGQGPDSGAAWPAAGATRSAPSVGWRRTGATLNRRIGESGYDPDTHRIPGAMKVYTKKGDDGTTGLFYGGRVAKGPPGPAAYGAVDEAVGGLGLARAETGPGDELHELLVRLQRELFVVGAELATAPENRHKLAPGKFLVTAEMVAALEPIIDDVTSRFEAPRNSCCPARTGSPPRSTSPAPSCAGPSGSRCRPSTPGGSRSTARSCRT